jgi:MFS family permease
MTTDLEATRSAGIWTTFRESPRAVKAILTGVFINRLGGLLNIFLVLFLTAKGYSVEQATLALGVYGAGAVVGVLAGGALADRLGVRTATVVGMVGSGTLLAALLYLPSYPLILVAVGLASMVAQMYRPAASALLAELTPTSRLVMTMAMYRFGLNLGTTAAPLVGFALYHLNHQQYTLLFWADATVAFVYAIVAFLVLPRRTPRTADPAASAASAPKVGYRMVLADRRYLLYLLATFLNAVVYVQYMSTLPLDVTAQGIAIFWYSAVISMNGLLVIAFELLLTKLSQKWPLRLTVGLAFALVGAGVAVYGLPLGPAVIIIGTLIWTLGEIVGGPAAFAYPAIAGPAHLRGRYIGSFQFVFGLGTAVGPLVGGLLFARLGHAVWPVLALAGAGAVVLGVAAIRAPRTDDDQPAAAAEPVPPAQPAADPAATDPVAAADLVGTTPPAR